MGPVGKAADRVKSSLSWLWSGGGGLTTTTSNSVDSIDSNDERNSNLVDDYVSKRVDRSVNRKWIINDASTCGQLNPTWSDVPGASEALIDTDLYENMIRIALAKNGVWPSYGHTLVHNSKKDDGTWAELSDIDMKRITDYIRDSDNEDLIPKSAVLKAPANAIPRWAVKQLRPYVNMKTPCSLQRKQIEALHEEWYPISYDHNYFDGIAPSCEYIDDIKLLSLLSSSEGGGGVSNTNSSHDRQKVTLQQLYNYQYLVTIASVIPAGSYDIEYPTTELSHTSEISLDNATYRSPWMPSKIKPGSVFNGCRDLKKIVLCTDLVIGLINIRKGYAEYTESDYIGCLDVFRDLSNTEPPETWIEETGYIMSFGVSDTWMNMGIGKEIMDRAMIVCNQQGIKLLTLHVISHNYGAKRFYEREHFRKINKQPGYYEFNGIIWTADTYCVWVPAYLKNKNLIGQTVNHILQTKETINKAMIDTKK